MAYIDTENMPLHMPVPGSREPAQIALLNENCVTLSNHDHTNGKGLAMGRLRSGLDANRPAAGSAGNVYFATDTGRFYVDTGTAWVQFITEGGQATVTGWTLIDPVIRDTLQFGPEGSGTIDNYITRTGANALRTDSNLGVGVAPAAWSPSYKAIQIGTQGALFAVADHTQLGANTYSDGADKALAEGPASKVYLQGGALTVATAPNAAAGAAQTFTPRLTVDQAGNVAVGMTPPALHPARRGLFVGDRAMLMSGAGYNATELRVNSYQNAANQTIAIASGTAGALGLTNDTLSFSNAPYATEGAVQAFTTRLTVADVGTVVLNPVPGQAAIIASMGGQSGRFYLTEGTTAATNARVYSGGALELDSSQNIVAPARDNALYLGTGSYRWTAVYAVNGAIQTSSAEMKEDITPLDPAACVEAVLETDWVSFSYLPPMPPEYVAPPDIAYDERDSNEVKAEKKVLRDEDEAAAKAQYAKMLVETQPARDQKGYVLGSATHQTSGLFGLSDRKSASPSSDLAVVACALQNALKRIAELEAKVGQVAPAA